MKKRFLATILSCVILSLTTNTYSKPRKENPLENRIRNYYMYSYSKGWELNTSIGPQVYFGEQDFRYGIFNRIQPAFSLGIKKQTSEYWAFRIKLTGGIQSDATLKSEIWSIKEFTTYGVSGDLMLNLNRLFSSKTYNKTPEFWGFAGVGADKVSKTETGGTYPIFNMGVHTQFPINEALDFSIETKGVIVPEEYDGTSSGWHVEGFLTTLLGVTYHF